MILWNIRLLQSTGLLCRGLALWHIWCLPILPQNVSRAFVKMDIKKKKKTFHPHLNYRRGLIVLFFVFFSHDVIVLKNNEESVGRTHHNPQTGHKYRKWSKDYLMDKGGDWCTNSFLITNQILILSFYFQIWITYFARSCLSKNLTITIDTTHFFRSLNNSKQVWFLGNLEMIFSF